MRAVYALYVRRVVFFDMDRQVARFVSFGDSETLVNSRDCAVALLASLDAVVWNMQAEKSQSEKVSSFILNFTPYVRFRAPICACARMRTKNS